MRKIIAYEFPDRIPAVLAGRPEVDRALVEFYGVDSMDDVHRILGTNGWGHVGLRIDFPDYARRCNSMLVGDMPYAGRRFIFHDERTFEDEWGVVRRVGTDRRYVEWVTGPLAEVDDLDRYEFPRTDRIVSDPGLAEKVRAMKAQGQWVSGGVAQPFKAAWELRGMENLLMDYALNPSFVHRLYDEITSTFGEILRRCTEAGVDQISIGGDIAMQHDLIMGPRLWREIDKLYLARMIAACKAVNPDVHVFIHSDGNLTSIMDDLIEIGFDIIDPIQPECMSPLEVKRRWGNQIVLHGCGSLQKTLPFGTPEDCRNEVRNLIRDCGYNGGLVLRISNAIGFDVPIENVVAWFETARDFDFTVVT